MVNNSKIVIFGAGGYGRKLLDIIGNKNVEFFVDNNTMIHGTEYKGIVVRPVSALDNIKGVDVVVSTRKYFDEIKEQIELYQGIVCYRMEQYLIKREFDRKPNARIVLLNTHEGINVGDYFINIAERYFLRKYFSDVSFVEITAGQYFRERKYVKSRISDDFIILISGGGYMGSLWMEFGENNIRNIIEDYPDNKIVILPQTMFFESSQKGRQEELKSSIIYNKHSKLTICLRDRISYELAARLFDNKVKRLLMPDMAMIIDKSFDSFKRDGFILSFRTDKESKIPKEKQNQIKNIIEQLGIQYSMMDMMADETVFYNIQSDELDNRMKRIQRSKLVITDRLHCMLMCLVTGTPCVVFDNLTRKISGVCEWIEDCEYIKIIQSIDDVREIMEWAYKSEELFVYKHAKLDIHYDKLADTIINGD